MEEGSLLKVCLEENLVPVDSVKLHESLSRWNIDKSGVVIQSDSTDSFRIPEQLIHIVIPDNLIMISLSS